MAAETETARVVEVKDIDPRHRHMVIQQLFEHLAPGASLQLIVDHDRSRCGSSSKRAMARNAGGAISKKVPTPGVCGCKSRTPREAEVIYRVAKRWAAPAAVDARSDPRRLSSPSRADRLEMLAATSRGVGECPAWIVMELEAGEKVDREPACGEERKGS